MKANLINLAQTVEMPLVKGLSRYGIYWCCALNTDALNESAGILRNDIIELEKKIIEIAGVEFNIASPKQLGEVIIRSP